MQLTLILYIVSYVNSSQTMFLIPLDSRLAPKHANKASQLISNVSVNHWLQLLIHIHQEL